MGEHIQFVDGQILFNEGQIVFNCGCCEEGGGECQGCFDGPPATITGTFKIPDPNRFGNPAGFCEPWYTFYEDLVAELEKYEPPEPSPYCCYYRGPTGSFTGTYITLDICRSDGLDPEYRVFGELWTDDTYATPVQNPLGEDIVFFGEFGVGQVDCDNFTARTGNPFTGEGHVLCDSPIPDDWYGWLDFVVGTG